MRKKDMTFSQLMARPDEQEQADIWCFVMESAKMFEEEKGYSRQTICEGLLRATLDLVHKREDERYFQKPNNARRFYLWASDFTRQKLNSFISYREQWSMEKTYGKDALSARDSHFYKSEN